MATKESERITNLDILKEIFHERDSVLRTTHKHVIEKIAMNIPVDSATVAMVLNAIPFVIQDSLEVEGDTVVIKGLGTWKLMKYRINKKLKNASDSDYSLRVSAKTSRGLIPYKLQKG